FATALQPPISGRRDTCRRTRRLSPGSSRMGYGETMHASASRCLSMAVLLAAGLATPAGAKKAPAPTCSVQFAVAQSGAPSMPPSVMKLVSIDATGVTVSTACGAVVTQPKRRVSGWKFRAHWRPCDGARRVVLAATVDPDCTALSGVL